MVRMINEHIWVYIGIVLVYFCANIKKLECREMGALIRGLRSRCTRSDKVLQGLSSLIIRALVHKHSGYTNYTPRVPTLV